MRQTITFNCPPFNPACLPKSSKTNKDELALLVEDLVEERDLLFDPLMSNTPASERPMETPDVETARRVNESLRESRRAAMGISSTRRNGNARMRRYRRQRNVKASTRFTVDGNGMLFDSNDNARVDTGGDEETIVEPHERSIAVRAVSSTIGPSLRRHHDSMQAYKRKHEDAFEDDESRKRRRLLLESASMGPIVDDEEIDFDIDYDSDEFVFEDDDSEASPLQLGSTLPPRAPTDEYEIEIEDLDEIEFEDEETSALPPPPPPPPSTSTSSSRRQGRRRVRAQRDHTWRPSPEDEEVEEEDEDGSESEEARRVRKMRRKKKRWKRKERKRKRKQKRKRKRQSN